MIPIFCPFLNLFKTLTVSHIDLQNNNLKDKELNRERDWESFYKKIEEALEFLRGRVVDLRTIDVVTAKGNFTVDIPIESGPQSSGIGKIIDTNPTSVTILAKTQIQIDGDRVNVIPAEVLGSFTPQNILDFHNATLKSAEEMWQNRINAFYALFQTLFSLISLHRNKGVS